MLELCVARENGTETEKGERENGKATVRGICQSQKATREQRIPQPSLDWPPDGKTFFTLFRSRQDVSEVENNPKPGSIFAYSMDSQAHVNCEYVAYKEQAK